MKLTDDLKSAWLIHAKGALFALLGLMAVGAIWIQIPTLQNAVVLSIAIWACCRFYYYLFYVLERYLGRKKKFAGVWDALRFLIRRRESENDAKSKGA